MNVPPVDITALCPVPRTMGHKGFDGTPQFQTPQASVVLRPFSTSSASPAPMSYDQFFAKYQQLEKLSQQLLFDERLEMQRGIQLSIITPDAGTETPGPAAQTLPSSTPIKTPIPFKLNAFTASSPFFDSALASMLSPALPFPGFTSPIAQTSMFSLEQSLFSLSETPLQLPHDSPDVDITPLSMFPMFATSGLNFN